MKRMLMSITLATLVAAAPILAQENPTSSDPRFAPSIRSAKIAVNDFAKSIAFYTALGMKEGPKRGDTQELVWDDTRKSGIMMVSPEYASRAKMERGGTYLMFVTPDVQAIANRLRRMDYPSVGEPKAMGKMVTVLMLRDPDGNQIELLGPLPAE